MAMTLQAFRTRGSRFDDDEARMLLEDGEFERLIDTIPNERMEALRRHPWPGNVRALRNVIERAMTAWRVRGAGGAAGLLGLKPPTLEAG